MLLARGAVGSDSRIQCLDSRRRRQVRDAMGLMLVGHPMRDRCRRVGEPRDESEQGGDQAQGRATAHGQEANGGGGRGATEAENRATTSRPAHPAETVVLRRSYWYPRQPRPGAAAMDRVTFAASSGIVWLVLAVHFAAGLVSIVGGTVALSVAKGGPLHKRSGLVFTWGMVVLGLTAAGIGMYENRPSQAFAGLIVVYLVLTALTTVKPVAGLGQRFDVALMIFAFACAMATLYGGVTEWVDPSLKVVGRPRVVPPLVIGTVMLLAAIGDVRTIRAGGLRGSRRLARHLWRMCFALFIATGSFFLGQMKFIPQPVRVVPLLLLLAFAPILFLGYWMWRVRVRGRLSGIVVGVPQPR